MPESDRRGLLPKTHRFVPLNRWRGAARMRPLASLRGRTIALLVAFSVLDVLGIAAAYATQVRLSSSDQRSFAAQKAQLDLERLQTGMLDQEVNLISYGSSGAETFRLGYMAGGALVRDAERDLNRAEGIGGTAQFGDLKTSVAGWHTWADGFLATIESGGTAAAGMDQELEGQRLFAAFQQQEEALGRKLATAANVAHAQSARRSDFLIAYLPIVAALGLVVLLALSVVLFRSTLSPIGRLIAASSEIARGGSVPIPGLGRRDEVGHLAHAVAALERSAREKLAVSQAMVEVTGQVELAAVLNHGIKRLREVLGAREVAISLTGLGRADVVAAEPHPLVSHSLPGASPGSEAMRRLEPVIGDLRDDVWDPAIRAWQLQHGLGSVLAVPMISGGQLLGVACSVRELGQPGFGPEDSALAELIVRPLAAAVHVCSLFDELTQANEELQRASRVKSEFLASMSHELRTPLNAILGFSELLLVNPDGGFDEATRVRFLETINSSGKHLLGLINDVLDLSKIKAGRMELRLAPFDVAEAVQSVLAAIEPLTADKHISLVSDVTAAGVVVADMQRISQVLFNLLSNAIKFTPEGGTVLISGRRLESEVEVSVADNGIGISPADVDRIFDRFEQVESGRGAASPGTGLGLALTRSLIELHGGRVWVVSEPGVGSTFTVSLPLTSVAGPPEPEPQPANGQAPVGGPDGSGWSWRTIPSRRA